MSEIRPTSQQMDREKLSQDIEKLKLAVKDTSLSRTWDDFSDSDEDALHITEDQNSHDVTDDGHQSHHVERVGGLVERFFPEEAIQNISQDSLGSLGSVELTNSPEVCLALNREYQDWIRKNLTRIQIVLEHNRQCQREVRLEMQEKSSEKMALNAKRKTLTVYAKPYFKTADGSFPPPNDDTMIKRNSRELDPFIRPPKSYLVFYSSFISRIYIARLQEAQRCSQSSQGYKRSTSERNKLRGAVQGDRLQKSLRPFMNRKEFEVERLRLVTAESEEEMQIKEKIEDIDNKMKAIRVSTDVSMIYGDLKELESIDWMKIANVDFEGQRSAESCKLFWLNAAHPNINILKWMASEDTKLVELVSRFEGVHWVEIAEELGTNRSAFMCLQRYQTKLNPCLQTGKWTPEEDDFLKEVINNCRAGDSIPWSTVAYYVEGRSREQCARRWEQLHPKSFKKGKWTVEEDKKLMEAAKLFGVNKWWKIREFVPGRTAAQCRERWKNTLDHSIHFGEWRYEEDRTLWLTVQELGVGHWQSIAKEYLPGRTDNMCLQRYRRLVHWYQENKAQERVKRQSKAGGWQKNRRWKKTMTTDKQQTKRKQTEKVIEEKAKTDEKQKEILSALKYVEGVCADRPDHGQGDGGCSIRETIQISDSEKRPVSESGDHQYSANEIEAMRRDQDLGIVIPRPSTRSCLNRNCLPELRRYRLRSNIGRRVASQVLLERRAPSNLRSRLDDLVRGKGTSGFSQPLQDKLQSLSDNATIRELIDLSAEVKQEVGSTLGSTSGQNRGRPKRSEEETYVEHKISVLACNPLMRSGGMNRCIKFTDEDSGRTGLRSSKKNSEDKHGKVVNLMANALGFRKCPRPSVPSSPVQRSSVSPDAPADAKADATPDATPPPQTTPVQPSSSAARHGFAKAMSSLSPETSVVVVLKRATQPSQSSSTESMSMQHTPQNGGSTPEFSSDATSDPRLEPGRLNKAAYGRAALEGAQAKVYQMPPLPPSFSTLTAFKTLLLNRAKLLSVAGKFHIPGILPVPKSMKKTVQQEALKAEDKGLDSATTGVVNGTETTASVSAESLESREDETKETGARENSLSAEAESKDINSAMDDGSAKTDGDSSKGLPSASKRGRKAGAGNQKSPRKLSRLADADSKQLQLQVVKSKLRSRRVLAAIHASHDYQLLRSRFLSLYLWPAFMSTLPLEEVKPGSSVEVTKGTEADDAMSSAEEQERDYVVDECSSDDDDDDWSKRHYKKRYTGSGKPRSYSGWKRKEERNDEEEEMDVKDAASMDTSLVSSQGPSSSFADNFSSQTESQKKRRMHGKRTILVIDDLRKSRKSSRLAEKRDLKQRTEDQESVVAIEHHRVMLKATDAEYDSESSAPRRKRRKITSDMSDTEQKPVGAELWERSRLSAQNEFGDLRANAYMSNECHVQNTLSDYVVPSDLSASSAEPADCKAGIVDSNAFLQPAFLDAGGYLQPFIVGPDGILQPVVVNSGQFVETVVDSDGFLRPSSVLTSSVLSSSVLSSSVLPSSVLPSSEPVALLPSLVDTCQFIQPMALNFDEVSGNSESLLCPTRMDAAGDGQHIYPMDAAGKLEPLSGVSSTEEDSVDTCSSSQFSFGFDKAPVPVDFTVVAMSSKAEESDRYSTQGTDKPTTQMQHDVSSAEDLMDCSDDVALVTEAQESNCLEELKSEVDTASGSLDESCEEDDATTQSNYNESKSDKEATDQKQAEDSNLDVLIRASELMGKNWTDAGLETGNHQAPCTPPAELNIPATALHSSSDPIDAGHVQLESRSSDATKCIVFHPCLAETGFSSLSTEQKADVAPISISNRQLEGALSSTQYSCLSGDTTTSYGEKSVPTDRHHTSSVTSSNITSCFTDLLVIRADEANDTVPSPAITKGSSDHHVDDRVITIDDIASAEEETGKQSAGTECIGQLELAGASMAREPTTAGGGSTCADDDMDWIATPTIETVASSSSESPQSSVSSVRIVSTVQSEIDSNADQETKDSINDDLKLQMTFSESESPIATSDASDRLNAKTSVIASPVNSVRLANSQQSPGQQSHVSLTSSSFSSANTFAFAPASPQVMVPNVVPVLGTMPSVLQSATAAAVQQLTTMIMSQMLESLQMQMPQFQGAQFQGAQFQGAQNFAFPLVNALMQSTGLPSSAGLQAIAGLQQPAFAQALSGLQQPAFAQAFSGLQQPAFAQALSGLQQPAFAQALSGLQQPVSLQQSPLSQQSATWRQPADVQSCAAFQSPGLQPSVGLLGARSPLDWSASSGLQPGAALQVDASLQPSSLGLQNGTMMQTPVGRQINSIGEMGSSQHAAGCLPSISGMQGSVDSQLVSGKILSAESILQASPLQSNFSTLSMTQSSPQAFLQTATGHLSGSPAFSGYLPGSQPYLYPVPGNLVTAQPMSGNFSGLYPLLQTAPWNLPGSQPLLQNVTDSNLCSSQSVLQTVSGNMPASQSVLETLPQNPSSASAAAAVLQNTSVHSNQLHDFISMNPGQSSAAMNPTAAASLNHQLLSCFVPQMSGQFQQPVSGVTMATNSCHQMAASQQGLGPYVDASVLQQIHSESASAAYMMPMHPTNHAASLIYRSPTVSGYLPSFMGMQVMNNGPTVLPVVSSFLPIQTSATAADQQTPAAPSAVGSSSAPVSST